MGEPKLIVLASELTSGQGKAKITTHIQDCHKAIKVEWPSAVVALQYTARWWWNPNILHGWEGDLLVWPAHYPYFVQDPDGTWRQAYHFEDVDPILPIHNNFTPVISEGFKPENAAAWQFTEKGIIEPISRMPKGTPRVDLDYLKRWFFNQVYGIVEPPPDPPPGTKKLLTDKAKELRVIAGELDAHAELLN